MNNNPTPPEVDNNAIMDVWEAISEGIHYDRQFILKLEQIEPILGKVEDAVCYFTDYSGSSITLDVWASYELSMEWSEGEWYAVSGVSGSVWQKKSGQIKKRLNTTESTEVTHISPGVNPATLQNALESHSTDEYLPPDVETETNSHTTSAAADRDSNTKEKDQSIDIENLSKEGVLHDIVSDFDNLYDT